MYIVCTVHYIFIYFLTQSKSKNSNNIFKSENASNNSLLDTRLDSKVPNYEFAIIESFLLQKANSPAQLLPEKIKFSKLYEKQCSLLPKKKHLFAYLSHCKQY